MEEKSELLARLGRVVLQRLEGLHRAGVATIPHGSESILPTAALQPGTSARTPSPPVVTESRFVMKPASIASSATSASSSSEPVDMAPRKTSQAAKATNTNIVPPANAHATAGTSAAIVTGDRAAALSVLKSEVEQCTLCKELARTRTQTVFGVGNIRPRVVFFGEAPGADEDRTGEPFVGRAGQLLTKIIEACTFKREDVYIMNVLKCRPPDNRTPNEDEMENCRRHFERQLAILQPEYIVCAGATPMKALLTTKKSVGQMRGSFHDYHGAKVVITYHPAYLLRNPPAKKFVWDDMKMMLADMGIELPK
jgi:DNA polymerase